MSLQCNLFKGDKKLEACLISDPAHVTPGAVGAHVGKIQTALSLIENADIDSSERAGGRYGPSTASAVLGFKEKRKIINRSYQSRADNIVGKMTIAALDREMVEVENGDGDPRRIHCRDFPRGEVRVTSGAKLGFAIAAPSGATAPTSTPRSEALGRVMEASLWVNSALSFIRTRRAQILSGLPSTQFQGTEEQKALDIHFKLFQHPRPLDHLNFLDKVYTLILRTLVIADSVFADDSSTGDFANAFLGGFFEPSHPQRGKIRFGPAYAGKGRLFQTSVIVHESAHFVDSRIDHFASELPPLLGSPVDGVLHKGNTKNYHQLTPFEAAENAYSYAQFALHAFKRFDKRIVPFNE